ncbi:hypothetical protein AAG906_011843 [Vitis piasezkii]
MESLSRSTNDGEDDDEDDEDKLNENEEVNFGIFIYDIWSLLQFIIDILKEAYANKDKNLKNILHRNEHALFKQIKDSKTRKELSGALMLMATLIATVTYAAAFTIPGGFNAEGRHKGKVVLGGSAAFKAFVITDTIAMTSSMMAAVVLVTMPFRANKNIRDSSLGVSVFLLWLALVTMGMAFVTGLYAVLSEVLPLAIVVYCIGGSFSFIVYSYYGALLEWFISLLEKKKVGLF